MTDFNKVKPIFEEHFISYLNQHNLVLFSLSYYQDFETNILQVLLEDTDRILDLDELVKISEDINVIVDKLDLIAEDYALEVSTPGAERPLRDFAELTAQLQQYIYIEFYESVDNFTALNGTLVAVDNETQLLTIEYQKKKSTMQLQTNYSNIKFARCAIKF